jgi:hypothetical protein
MLISLNPLSGVGPMEVEIPNSLLPPTAIVWGDRVFIRNFLGIYHECEAYFVATTGGPPMATPPPTIGPS